MQVEFKPNPFWFVGTIDKPTCFFFLMWARLDQVIQAGHIGATYI